MKKIILSAIVLTTLGVLASCKGGSSNSKTATPTLTPAPRVPTTRLPTATEVFHLRSECARFAEKILEGNIIGIALTHSQISHYNPLTNRCSVDITVQKADLKDPVAYINETLFDGQTGEMLAQYTVQGRTCPSPPDCKITGFVFDQHYQNYETNLDKSGPEEAHEYIDSMMDDDRKR